MEYLAFKSLITNEQGILISPLQKTPWGYTIWQGELRPALFTSSQDVESGTGIFAATACKASEYGAKIYLVAPLPDENGEVYVALSENGWRSASAVVVAGAFKRGDNTPFEIIVASYLQGYRQVPGILAEALTKTKKFDLILDLLCQDDSTEIIRAIAGMDEELPTEVFRAMAKNKDAVTRQMVARRCQDSAVYLTMIDDPDPIVRGEVMRRPEKMPHKIIEKMAQDEDATIRKLVAERWDTPEKIQKKLTRDPDVLVRIALAKRDTLSEEIIEILIDDPDVQVRRTIAEREYLTYKFVRHLAGDPDAVVREALTNRSNLPDDIICVLASDPDEDVRDSILGHHQITRQALHILAQDKSPEIRRRVAKKCGTEDEDIPTLKILASDPDVEVRRTLAKNVFLPGEILCILAYDEDVKVRQIVAENSNILPAIHPVKKPFLFPM